MSGIRRDVAIALGFLIAGALVANAYLPASAVLAPEPFLDYNFSKHVYFADLHAEFLAGSGASWGYDPTFGSGMVTGAAWFVSYLLPAFVVHHTPLDGSDVLRLIVFFSFALPGVLTYLAARWLGLRPVQAAVAATLDLLYTATGIRGIMSTSSMAAASLSSSLILPAVGLIDRLLRRKVLVWCTPLVVVPACLLIGTLNPHGLFGFALCIGLLVLWRHREFLNPRALAPLSIGGGAALLLLWPWFATGLNYLSQIDWVYTFFRFVPHGWGDVQRWVPLLAVAQPFYLFVLIANAWGLRANMRANGNGGYLTVVGAVIVAATAVGVCSDSAYSFFTLRFIDFAFTVFAIAGSAALPRIGYWRGSRKSAVLVGSLFLVATALHAWKGPAQVQVDRTPSVDQTRVAEWLAVNSDNGARVLVENGIGPGFVAFDLAARFRLMMPDRIFAGPPTVESSGLVSMAYLASGDLSFFPMEAIDADRLASVLRLNNVGWIVAHNEATVARLRRETGIVREVAGFGPFAIFEGRQSRSFFLRGNGDVRWEPDHLKLNNLQRDPDGIVVLSFHWFENLRAIPPVAIERYTPADDPVGFIQLRDPPPDLTIIHDPSDGMPHFATERPFFAYYQDRLDWYAEHGYRLDVPPGTGIVRESE